MKSIFFALGLLLACNRTSAMETSLHPLLPLPIQKFDENNIKKIADKLSASATYCATREQKDNLINAAGATIALSAIAAVIATMPNSYN